MCLICRRRDEMRIDNVFTMDHPNEWADLGINAEALSL